MHVGCLTDIYHILILDQGRKDLKESGHIAQLWRNIEIERVLEGGLAILTSILSYPYSIRIADGVAETEGGLFFRFQVYDLVIG